MSFDYTPKKHGFRCASWNFSTPGTSRSTPRLCSHSSRGVPSGAKWAKGALLPKQRGTGPVPTRCGKPVENPRKACGQTPEAKERTQRHHKEKLPTVKNTAPCPTAARGAAPSCRASHRVRHRAQGATPLSQSGKLRPEQRYLPVASSRLTTPQSKSAS